MQESDRSQERKPTFVEQKPRTDIFQREGELFTKVHKHICEMIDKLHRIKEVPGKGRVLLDLEQRDKLKQEIRDEITFLRSNLSTAFNKPGKLIRSAVLKRYENPGPSADLSGWQPGGKYAEFTETDVVFQLKFREVREKHEIIEDQCGLSTIAKIEEALILNNIETNSLLRENLKVIKSYHEAKGSNVSEALDKVDEIYTLCHNPENKGKITEIFRNHLTIQSQESQSLKRKLSKNTEGDLPTKKVILKNVSESRKVAPAFVIKESIKQENLKKTYFHQTSLQIKNFSPYLENYNHQITVTADLMNILDSPKHKQTKFVLASLEKNYQKQQMIHEAPAIKGITELLNIQYNVLSNLKAVLKLSNEIFDIYGSIESKVTNLNNNFNLTDTEQKKIQDLNEQLSIYKRDLDRYEQLKSALESRLTNILLSSDETKQARTFLHHQSQI
jgi:hypothetical protein